jgi:hypothetical protein
VASLDESSLGVTSLVMANSTKSSFVRVLSLAHTNSLSDSRSRRPGFLYILMSISTTTRKKRRKPQLPTLRSSAFELYWRGSIRDLVLAFGSNL